MATSGAELLLCLNAERKLLRYKDQITAWLPTKVIVIQKQRCRTADIIQLKNSGKLTAQILREKIQIKEDAIFQFFSLY